MSRISPGTILVAFVAIASGLIGAYVVRESLERDTVSLGVDEKVTDESMVVPLSGMELKAGRTITLGDISLVTMTNSQIREAGYTEAYMTNPSQIIGRVLRSDVAKDATFNVSMFYPEGTGPHIAEMVEDGKRAVTVPVELDAAVSGFATPGTWVDVVFRSDSKRAVPGSQAEALPEVAVTLLERVKVLAIEQEVSQGARIGDRSNRRQKASVTLQVKPSDAMSLRLVEGRGSLALTLRHPEDDTSTATSKPLSMDDLLNLPPKVNHHIEVFRGSRVSRVDFEGVAESRTLITGISRTDEPITESKPGVAQVADSAEE